ncbi:hypothetical protein Tco_0000594 [Tanacetum coccineum]
MYHSGSSSSTKAAADFEQGADSEPSCHIGVRGMDSEPTFVEMKGLSSSDSDPSAPVEMKGLSSSDSDPPAPVEMKGLSSSDSDPSTPVEMKGHSSSDIADSASIEMKGNSFSDGDDSAYNEMKGNFSSDGDDSSSYESDFHDSEADNEFEEDSGSMFVAEPGGELVEPESEDESDASTRIETIQNNLLMLREFKNGGEEISRDLYGTKTTPDAAVYWDEPLYVKVEDVKAAVDAICMRFECVRSSLRIISGSKGIVVGPLSYRVKDLWISFEKDTVFQRLETPDFCERYRCILVTAATAKGQPNVSTRMFVQSLRRNLQIPVFALVDCNPSVFIIMSAYRHGAETRAFENHRMAVPDLKSIGLHPTEVEKYNISKYGVPLTLRDIDNCKRLLKKQCVNDVPDFKRQLEHMLTTNRKYQIESLGTSVTSITRYLLEKLEIKDWI